MNWKSPTLVVIVIAGVTLLGMLGLYAALWQLKGDDITTYGSIGDAFGPLASVLALCAFTLSLWSTMRQSELQSRIAEEQRQQQNNMAQLGLRQTSLMTAEYLGGYLNLCTSSASELRRVFAEGSQIFSNDNYGLQRARDDLNRLVSQLRSITPPPPPLAPQELMGPGTELTSRISSLRNDLTVILRELPDGAWQAKRKELAKAGPGLEELHEEVGAFHQRCADALANSSAGTDTGKAGHSVVGT